MTKEYSIRGLRDTGGVVTASLSPSARELRPFVVRILHNVKVVNSGKVRK